MEDKTRYERSEIFALSAAAALEGAHTKADLIGVLKAIIKGAAREIARD